eukprot:TRINITY_DN10976_c0_g2_i24.p2 TRINITY_DN10976_c0_g2~~TRINITY_DN10976_c0_g2_i24.p2  ORF type:complete len:133 (+),score=25.18 TRINITY_DN10976_c0_g2_i24:350-748(+)
MSVNFQIDALENIREAGYNVSVIKDSLQRKLRDASRNEDFCKIFTSDDSPDILICESDDVVFQFTWTDVNDTPTRFFWFAKRDSKQMTNEERAIHLKMQLWTPADREKIKDRVDAGLHVLHVIVDAIRYFLG